MTDEKTSENGEPGDEEESQTMAEWIKELEKPITDVGAALVSLLRVGVQPAKELIDLVGDIGEHITDAKAQIDMFSHDRIVQFTKSLKESSGLDSQDAANVVISSMHNELEFQKAGLDMASHMVVHAIKAVAESFLGPIGAMFGGSSGSPMDDATSGIQAIGDMVKHMVDSGQLQVDELSDDAKDQEDAD